MSYRGSTGTQGDQLDVWDGEGHDTDDDDEESLLELYELRRWKQQFAVEQTRSLIDRVDELTAHVHRLERMMIQQEETRCE